LGAASPVTKQAPSGRCSMLLVLAAVTLGLLFVISNRFTTLTDVIAPLTGHLMGLGLAASLALLLPRRRLQVLTAGMMLTVGLHGWLGLARCCGAPPAGQSAPIQAGPTKVAGHPSLQTLTVLALNTWHGHADTPRLERYLAAVPADVVVLSEFGPDKRPLLANLAAAYPFQVDCADWACSLALLSRLPLEASGVGRIAFDQPAFVWARLGGSVTIIGTHLYRPSRDPWLHERQVTALAQFIGRIDSSVILAGDLNTSPWSSAFRKLRAGTGLAPVARLMPTWPAWPLALPQVALDHIFVSPDLAVAAAGTGAAVGSDHLPVWAQLERRPAALDRRRSLRSRFAASRPHLGGELLADLGGEQVGARNLRR
jgi:endonuclease/exonuclease/phosphatase (EEP) superfamily protein YafD